MDPGRLLDAAGLTVWIGSLAGAAAYVNRRVRFPRSAYAGISGESPGWVGVVSGLIVFGGIAYWIPNVVWVFNLFASGLVTYGLAAYVVALTVERRRARRLRLPEPGTYGTISVAEFAVFLAIGVPFGLAALGLTVYGIANEIGGNAGEGGPALGLGALAWFIAFFMGLFGSPPLVMWWRRQGASEPDAPAQRSSR